MGEVWLGIEGAALLRYVLDGDEAFVAARLAAIEGLVGRLGGGPFAVRSPVPELDVEEGYRAWAPVYDEMSNALIRAEEPLLLAGLDGVGVVLLTLLVVPAAWPGCSRGGVIGRWVSTVPMRCWPERAKSWRGSSSAPGT